MLLTAGMKFLKHQTRMFLLERLDAKPSAGLPLQWFGLENNFIIVPLIAPARGPAASAATSSAANCAAMPACLCCSCSSRLTSWASIATSCSSE